MEAVQEKSNKFLDILCPSMPACLVIPINEGPLESAELLWQMSVSLVLTIQMVDCCYPVLSAGFEQVYIHWCQDCQSWQQSTGQTSIKVYKEQCHKVKNYIRCYLIRSKINLLYLILAMIQCCLNQRCLLWKTALLSMKYQSSFALIKHHEKFTLARVLYFIRLSYFHAKN